MVAGKRKKKIKRCERARRRSNRQAKTHTPIHMYRTMHREQETRTGTLQRDAHRESLTDLSRTGEQKAEYPRYHNLRLVHDVIHTMLSRWSHDMRLSGRYRFEKLRAKGMLAFHDPGSSVSWITTVILFIPCIAMRLRSRAGENARIARRVRAQSVPLSDTCNPCP